MRKFANSLLIAERLQLEKEFKMKLDQAKRWGVSVGQIEKLWEADKQKKVMELNNITKTPKWTPQQIKDADEVRSIMEEYECEEYQAKQIQTKRHARLAPGSGAVRCREPEVTVIRPLVRPRVKPVGG